MFKNVSIGTKTFFLSSAILGIIFTAGVTGIYSLDQVGRSVTKAYDQSLPAVRNITRVDMMQDELRALVYRSMVTGPEEKKDIHEDYKTFTSGMMDNLSEIQKLKLSSEIDESIKKSHSTVKKFHEDAFTVIEAAVAGDSLKAKIHLSQFLETYKSLRLEIQQIDAAVEDQVKNSSIASHDEVTAFTKFNMMIVAAGLILSALITFIAYRFIKGLTSELLHITSGLKHEAAMIVETSKSMAGVAGKLSVASTQQAASLQETVASIDEISAMISRNADSAGSSATMSQQSTLMAQKGKERAEEMMESINAIAAGNDEIIRQMQKSNTEITEIVRVIQDIGQKTQVINDIVFQTKLLSFNASVEAARAGEHGKGFAVVAEEVGNLASMSGTAATEITEMLGRSVKRVTEIVEGTKSLMDNLIRQSKEKVEYGTNTARECTKALDEILSNVSSVNEMVREISTASQEQSTGVSEVNKAMSELDHVTQTNSGLAQDSSRAANELNEQADHLNKLVEELTRMVGGKATATARVQPKAQPVKQPVVHHHRTNVISMKRPASKQVRPAAQPVKKVVGLEFEAPDSNDSRFEDV